MSKKNRATLTQQFSDFINRIAPFDGNPLVQKTEHITVETDFFDSVLLKEENTVSINSPAAAIALDFNSIDSYSINTSGSVATAFTITVSNLSHGQTGRVLINKKTNDTFSVASSTIAPINNISQSGTSLSIYIINIKGSLITFIDKNISKSDNISDNISDQLATSKAVRDLNIIKQNIAQENWIALTLINGASNAAAAIYVNPRRVPSYYKDTAGRVWLTGVVDVGGNETIATLPVGYRPVQNVPVSIGQVVNNDVAPRILTDGSIFAGGTNLTGCVITLDGISFTTHN